MGISVKTSDRGKALIKSFEGCKLMPYKDGGGIYTVGWGHTGAGCRPGFEITQEQADTLFDEDVAHFEKGVLDLVLVPITQGQFDALVSFAYNVGLDQDEDTKAEGLGDSTLLKKLNARDFSGAAIEFLKWNKDNGKVVAGLTRRRIAELAMFES